VIADALLRALARVEDEVGEHEVNVWTKPPQMGSTGNLFMVATDAVEIVRDGPGFTAAIILTERDGRLVVLPEESIERVTIERKLV
jgi:hypothetical protein